MTIEKILIVDDELLIRSFLEETLRRQDFEVTTAENAKKGISLIKENTYDLIFTDMKLPDQTGLDVIQIVKEYSPTTSIIVITAFGSIENAVEAMRLGALDYLIKPFTPDTIEAIIQKTKGYSALKEENAFLRSQVSHGKASSKTIIAESPIMKKVVQEAVHVAKSNANVFISGESGTGKEVIAQCIHANSLRADRPFVKVNCAAIPDALIESEFFGHEKGAFTGANQRRNGRFELANGGSLLLDEITEVPLSLQAKLLRAIQEQEFERVGGSKPIRVDTRLISTTNRSIEEAIKGGMLREDLYYRLNVVPLHLPPLRSRPEDIIPLAEHFLAYFCSDNHKSPISLTPQAQERLISYRWPGNVRELANIIERAVVLDTKTKIDVDDLHLGKGSPLLAPQSGLSCQSNGNLPVGITLQELEKRFIVETLDSLQNNRTQTAKRLGISVRTLRNKLHQYNVT